MNHFFQTFSAIVRSTLLSSLQRIVDFLPNLLSAILILLNGWGLALLMARLIYRLFVSIAPGWTGRETWPHQHPGRYRHRHSLVPDCQQLFLLASSFFSCWSR